MQSKSIFALRAVETRTLNALRSLGGNSKPRTVTISTSQLAQEALAPQRSVREALRCLERFGFIRRKFNKGGVTTYHILAK